MLDTLPPSVPTGSARAARTAGKKIEFARQYCSRRAVPIRLISRHGRSLGTTRELRRIRTHKKRNRESLKWIAVSGPMRLSADYEARSARIGLYRRYFAVGTRIEEFRNADRVSPDRSRSSSFRRSVQSCQPGNGNARGTSTPRTHHSARMVQLVEAEVGPQQCELDKIELGAAAADPFEFIGNRF